MRDAVIVEAVRTPVGKRNGGLSGVHPVDLSAHVLRSLAERTGHRPGPGRRRHLGLRRPGRRADLRHRPQRRARRRLAGVGARRDDRPAVRVVPAVGALRRGRADRRPVRRGGRRRRRVDVPGADGRDACRSPGNPFTASGWLGRYGEAHAQPGRRRRDDRRTLGLEPRPSSTSTRLASHEKAAAAQDPGCFDGQIVPVPGSLTGGEQVSRRRGRSPGRHAGARWPACKPAFEAGRRHHRRQRLADLRRLRGAADDHLGPGPRARADPDRPGAHRGAGRRRPGDHAHRADPGDPKALQRSGLRLDDIGAFEVNEAFAPVPLAWLAEIGAAPGKR